MADEWTPIVRQGEIEVSASPQGYLARITMSDAVPPEWVAAFASSQGPRPAGSVRVGRPAGSAIEIVFSDADQLEPSVEHALRCVDFANARSAEVAAERHRTEARHEAQRLESATKLADLQRRAHAL
jgi:hypothetical protein